MSEVKRWNIGAYSGEAKAHTCEGFEFESIGEDEGQIFVLAEDFDAAQSELATLREELSASNILAVEKCLEVKRLREELATQDRVLRCSVPEEHKHCTSPVGSVQNYIGDLEQRNSALSDQNLELLEAACSLLSSLRQRLYTGHDEKDVQEIIDKMTGRAKPTESAASE